MKECAYPMQTEANFMPVSLAGLSLIRQQNIPVYGVCRRLVRISTLIKAEAKRIQWALVSRAHVRTAMLSRSF